MAARSDLDRKGAEEAIDHTDAKRARYHREYYKRAWDDPASFHFTINTMALGYDGAADLIVARAVRLGWSEG